MLKVMKQKLPLIGNQVFKLVGSPDLETSQINRKIADKQYKDGVGNTLFVLFSGILILSTLYAVSLLFAGVSNLALAAKGLVDTLFSLASAFPTVALAGSISYLGVVKAYVKFTEWEVSKARAIRDAVIREHAPRFSSNPSLTTRKDALDPVITESSPVVTFSSEPKVVNFMAQEIAEDSPEVQNVTPEGGVLNERHTPSL